MSIKPRAVLFDTGGTVLDWHGSLVREIQELGTSELGGVEPHVFVNEWRRRSMRGIVGQVRPSFNMDDVHLSAIDQTVAHFGLPALGTEARQRLWSGWHRLRAWPDFPPALARLRQRVPVVSFTMLPVPLVVDVSRANGLIWDAVVSCEMIGIYKPHPETYRTALAWLGLRAEKALMVACHNFDLNAAQDVGMHTAFVRRPLEWGPEGPPDPLPNRVYDHIVDTFDELADAILDGPGR
ncbi:MAG: HAD-IA family hydrolase [Gemmatimonadales bacterium]|nr:HAD-IA family hydrolase [Gemmatimonadales bacterium]